MYLSDEEWTVKPINHLKSLCFVFELLYQPIPIPMPEHWLLLHTNLRQDPLDLSFWSFLTFFALWYRRNMASSVKTSQKKIQSKNWSNVPPKLLACVRFLYKVVHKIGRLWKFNRAREIEFNFFTVWTIFMKLGTLVRHIHGYKRCLRFFNFCTKLWKIITKSLGKS